MSTTFTIRALLKAVDEAAQAYKAHREKEPQRAVGVEDIRRWREWNAELKRLHAAWDAAVEQLMQAYQVELVTAAELAEAAYEHHLTKEPSAHTNSRMARAAWRTWNVRRVSLLLALNEAKEKAWATK